MQLWHQHLQAVNRFADKLRETCYNLWWFSWIQKHKGKKFSVYTWPLSVKSIRFFESLAHSTNISWEKPASKLAMDARTTYERYTCQSQ